MSQWTSVFIYTLAVFPNSLIDFGWHDTLDPPFDITAAKCTVCVACAREKGFLGVLLRGLKQGKLPCLLFFWWNGFKYIRFGGVICLFLRGVVLRTVRCGLGDFFLVKGVLFFYFV